MAIARPNDVLQKLQPQHEAFCLHMVARPHNAAAAAIAAGFAPKSAKQRAHLFMRDPLILARIKVLIEEKHKALHMDVDEILARAAMLARVDVRALFDENGLMRKLTDLEEEHSVAIAGVEVTETYTGTGKKREKTGEVKRVKLRDPLPAIRLLAEHKKLVRNADEGVNALASAIADRLKAARERRKAKEK